MSTRPALGRGELRSSRGEAQLPMALANNYVQIYGQLKDLFDRISEGQAPDKFTRQHLKDIGFGGSNFRAVIPLLKALGFLAPDGTPTERYHEFRNLAQSRRVMGEALREAYSDLFTIKSNPTSADRELIEGKFKSTFNATPLTAKLMANTFFALLSLADLSDSSMPKKGIEKGKEEVQITPPSPQEKPVPDRQPTQHKTSLHYDIQIHLPATKDIEVFNAIFKALKEHLLE